MGDRSEKSLARTRRRLVAGVVVLLALVVAAWVQIDPIDPPPALTDREVAIIAHGGAQGHAPPNTLAAFALAIELGADVLEMDLQLTADGEVVTIHDGTVDATTDGTGPVGELTLDELQALDAGAGWVDEDGATPWRGQGVRHAALREVLESFPDTPMIIELKTDGGEAIIQPTIDLLVEHGRDDGSVTVASFDETYLVPVREQLPAVPTNMPESETYAFYVRHLAGLHPWWTPPGTYFQVPEYHDGRLVVSPRFTRAGERLGIGVHAWTINDPEQIHRMLDAGVQGIITDYPDRVVEVLAAREAGQAADPGGYGAQLERAERLQDTAGWLTPILKALTFLGDEEFYLLMLPITYWAISRRMGLRLGAMLLISAGLNNILKLVAATPRPSFLRPELGAVTETSFGWPSGHAQNGVAIWGLLATSVRRWWVRLALVALIVLIGWSRIHLGAHFLEDLWGGWAVGLALLMVFLALEGRMARWWQRVGTAERVLASVLGGLALIAPATLLAGRLVNVVPFPWVPEGVTLGGASAVITPAATLSGLGIGLAVLSARGGFDHRGPIGRRIVRVLVGLVGVVVLVEGLGAVFPGGEGPLALTLRALRYGAVGVWVGGLAPLLFVRLRLADPAPPTTDTEQVASSKRESTRSQGG